jgi:hypothetical protein
MPYFYVLHVKAKPSAECLDAYDSLALRTILEFAGITQNDRIPSRNAGEGPRHTH